MAPLAVPADPALRQRGAIIDRRREIRRWTIAIALTVFCYAAIVLSFFR